LPTGCVISKYVVVEPEVVTLSLPEHSSNCLPLLAAKILFQSQSNPFVICGGQSDNRGSPLSAKFGVSLVLHDSVSSGFGIISLSVVTARPLSNQFSTTNTKNSISEEKTGAVSLKVAQLLNIPRKMFSFLCSFKTNLSLGPVVI